MPDAVAANYFAVYRSETAYYIAVYTRNNNFIISQLYGSTTVVMATHGLH